MQWAIVIAAFLASAVEFVEAFTLVLVGALAAVATLAVIVATLGVALVTLIPLDVLRFVIGFLLLLFGLKWLKNAIQRYSGLKFLHDEEAIYAANIVQARARGNPLGHASLRSGYSCPTSLYYWKDWKWPSSSFPLAGAAPTALA